MPAFSLSAELPVDAAAAYAWHARPGAFERLVPPWRDVRIVARHPAAGSSSFVADGGRLELSMPLGPLRRRWVAVHRDCRPGAAFTDVQETGPFAAWTHVHRFAAAHAGSAGAGSVLTDEIDYRLPRWLGPGKALVEPLVRRDLLRTFAFRHGRTRGDLDRHAHWSTRPRLRIAIAGASGLVGSALAPFLTSGGHGVLTVGRAGRVGGSAGGQAPPSIRWDPRQGELAPDAFAGCDAVVHLSGANVASRWTDAHRREIRDSRVASTRLIAETMARMPVPPRTLVVASATGIYGSDRGDAAVDESTPAGEGFLADVCRDWEAASGPASRAGIRVVHLRIGVVLSPRGGALAKLITPFRLGLGGRIGDGRQWQSWIHLDDVVDLIHHVLMDERCAGAFNAVAPGAVTQGDFARTLARVLHRPAILPLPGTVVGALFGEMGRALLLGGVRVLPSRAAALGFRFRFPDLEPALRSACGCATP